jgi:hypothetical protein
MNAVRERNFEPFFTTKVVEGCGRGLAGSAYGIIKNHGASSWSEHKWPGTSYMITPRLDKEGPVRKQAEGQEPQGCGSVLLWTTRT